MLAVRMGISIRYHHHILHGLNKTKPNFKNAAVGEQQIILTDACADASAREGSRNFVRQ
jgi:hypothetical protein